MRHVVIVGASAGGLGTAEALRRLGFKGVITLIGDERGLPYDRPPLSKHLLAGEWQPDQLALRPAALVAGLDLDRREGVSATRLDTRGHVVVLSTGETLAYDTLVVATGVRARRWASCPADVHVLRTLSDALALRQRLQPGRRLVIVGGGFVGAEVAATARGLGVEVTLLETAAIPLASAVGVEAGQLLTDLHREHGVDVRAQTTVTDITGTSVRLADGTVLAADDVLLAIGSVPNIEWLTGSGLRVDDGLVCDQYCAAADDVYAVGDVARWYNPLFATHMRIEHRTNAAEQGLRVAKNLLNPLERTPFAAVPYFWSDQYETKIQAYGYLRAYHETLVLERAPGRLLVAYRADDRLVGVLGIGQNPKTLRAWRTRIAEGAPWGAATTAA